ncbi:hypothetical protein [Streptomyces sp. NPDC058964]|uniref:hypothetical protein n=1 Tax=Streptomyces sp. NPDC058964 TaxID=3346681 RepID=UPI0036B3894B
MTSVSLFSGEGRVRGPGRIRALEERLAHRPPLSWNSPPALTVGGSLAPGWAFAPEPRPGGRLDERRLLRGPRTAVSP